MIIITHLSWDNNSSTPNYLVHQIINQSNAKQLYNSVSHARNWSRDLAGREEVGDYESECSCRLFWIREGGVGIEPGKTLSDNPHCCGRTFRRVYAGRKIK